jgi:hypothetical protein
MAKAPGALREDFIPPDAGLTQTHDDTVSGAWRGQTTTFEDAC